jgi:hypothetical protein
VLMRQSIPDPCSVGLARSRERPSAKKLAPAPLEKADSVVLAVHRPPDSLPPARYGPKCGLQTVRKMLLGARLAGSVAKGFPARLRATLSEDQTSSDSRERPLGARTCTTWRLHQFLSRFLPFMERSNFSATCPPLINAGSIRPALISIRPGSVSVGP